MRSASRSSTSASRCPRISVASSRAKSAPAPSPACAWACACASSDFPLLLPSPRGMFGSPVLPCGTHVYYQDTGGQLQRQEHTEETVHPDLHRQVGDTQGEQVV